MEVYGLEGYLLYFDPGAASPVAMAATRLAPAIAFALFPAPIVGHNAELQGRFVPLLTTDAPAIAFVIAHNSS